MNRSKQTFAFVTLLLAITIIGCDRQIADSGSFPQRPIKVIVPFAAGGGSDSFARIIQSAIDENDLLGEKLVIINVPGAGGTIGSRRVKNARPDGYTILLLHEGIITAKHSGQAAYGPAAFTPIAGSGDATQVIAVAKDSPYHNLTELIDDAANRPSTIVFAANMGAPSHFAGLMLEQQRAGSKFRYTQTGGGAKRFAALQGGHVDVSAFSIAEFIQFQPAGMRAIALLGEQRHPDVPSVATAQEQGFDVISQNMQFWWAPKGTSGDRIEVIAAAIEKAMNQEAVTRQLKQMRIDPRFVQGDELDRELEIRTARISQVSSGTSDTLPNFPLITLAIVIALGLMVGYQRWDRQLPETSRRETSRKETSRKETSNQELNRGRWYPSLAVVVMTILYVLCLQFNSVGFRVSTFVYVCAIGLSVVRVSGLSKQADFSLLRTLSLLGVVALLLSIGVHYLFTSVLVVDLP